MRVVKVCNQVLPDTGAHPEIETLSKEEQEHLLRLLPRWNVILHNDDYHLAAYVVETLQKVVGLPFEQAWAVMLTAHTQGRAIVVTCPKEKAEHYRASLEGYRLTSSIEPAA